MSTSGFSFSPAQCAAKNRVHRHVLGNQMSHFKEESQEIDRVLEIYHHCFFSLIKLGKESKKGFCFALF